MEDGTTQNDTGIVDGGDSGKLGWKTELPESQRQHEAFATYASKSDLFKGHMDLYSSNKDLSQKLSEVEGKLGNAIFKPGDGATAEESEAYYRKLGKPEKSEEYEFPKSEGVEHDPKMIEWAQSTFHKANLTKEQASVIGKSWDDFMGNFEKSMKEANDKARSDAETAIKAELGEEYPKAQELTKRLLSNYAKPEEIAALDESGIGNHPVVIRLLFNLAKKTGEDTSPQGGLPKNEPVNVGMNYKSMVDFKGY